MIKIIYESNSKKLYGCCNKCCCRVECQEIDAFILDQNFYVKCPSCSNNFLLVKDYNAVLR